MYLGHRTTNTVTNRVITRLFEICFKGLNATLLIKYF